MSDIEEKVNEIIDNERPLLKFRWRNLQDSGCIRIASVLIENRFRHITEIDLCGNDIGDDGVTALMKSLALDRRLLTLSLNCNSYREGGMKAIAKFLQVNESLTSLDLSGSRSGDEGLKEITDCLCERHFLQELKVSRSSLGAGIGPVGAMALKRMIENNKSIRTLSLWGSRLGDEGITKLAAGITHNPNLTSLDLGWSGIGDEGFKTLGEFLVSNRTMQNLDLRNNEITTSGVFSFTNCIKAWDATTTSFFVANCTLNSVMLSGNPVFEVAETKKVNILEQKEKYLAKVAADKKKEEKEEDEEESILRIENEKSLGQFPKIPARKNIILSSIRATTRASKLASETSHINEAATALQELYAVLSDQGRERRVERAVEKHNQIVEEIARSRRELELALEAERKAKRDWWGKRAEQLHLEHDKRKEDEVLRLWNKMDMDRRNWKGASDAIVSRHGHGRK